MLKLASGQLVSQQEASLHCLSPQEEVFNILFVQSHRGEYIVYCHKCAASMRKNFTVLRQVTLPFIRIISTVALLFKEFKRKPIMYSTVLTSQP